MELREEKLVYTTNILFPEVATPCQAGQVASPLSSETAMSVPGGCDTRGYQWVGTLSWTCVCFPFSLKSSIWSFVADS